MYGAAVEANVDSEWDGTPCWILCTAVEACLAALESARVKAGRGGNLVGCAALVFYFREQLVRLLFRGLFHCLHDPSRRRGCSYYKANAARRRLLAEDGTPNNGGALRVPSTF
jgi:hypothetical protein